MSTTAWCSGLLLGVMAMTAHVTPVVADPILISRVRGVDGRAAALLDEAQWRSSTFQQLVAQLSASDLIVYVSRTVLDGTLRGALRFVGSGADGGRFLLVELNDALGNGLDAPSDRLAGIATLAHELHHALEVADADEVQDSVSFEAFYVEAGSRSSPDVVDTEAAQLAGEQVYFEMTGRKQ